MPVPDVATQIAEQESFGTSEVTTIAERVVVAPCSGRFVPLPPETFTTEGEWVERDQIVGQIRSGRQTVEVRCHCRGWMMGMLALPGQPIRQGEALFWIRGC